MALSASWQNAAAPQPPVTERQRRRRAFQAARRHSRRVRLLRVFLPVAGGFVVLALFVATRLSLPEGLDLAAARLSVTPSAIIMERPHLKGFDKRNQEYSVAADRAVQAIATPNLVRLETIVATLGTEGQSQARITAEAGDYDRVASTLKLHGAIAVQSPEGYSVTMTDADVDFNAGILTSPNPTTLVLGTLTTTGQRISVSDDGDLIRLEGGVRTTITPARPEGAPMQPLQEQVSR